MTSSYNYKTYYLGTPKEIEDSNLLVLLNSSDFGDISLESLDKISEKLESNPKLTKKAEKKEDGFFVMDLDGSIFDFDVILYYNQGSGYIGYTIFSSLQHCYSSSKIPFKSVKISIIFDRISGDGNGYFIGIQNYLDPNVENTKIIGSSEDWQYQNSDSIFFEADSEKNYLKFTNRIPDYIMDKELCVVTDSGIVSNYSGISGLNIISGVEIDYDSFSRFHPVFYKNDIALLKYSHQTGEFCVSSLSTLNAFGRPHDFTSGVIEEYSEFDDYCGQSLLFSDDREYYLYPLESPEKKLRYPKKTGDTRNYIVMDHWGLTKEIRYMSEPDLKKEVTRSCIVPEDFDYNTYIYKSKSGVWWEFRILNNYMYSSVFGSIISNLQINFINSRIGMYKEKGIYHFFPIEIGHSYEIRSDRRVLDKTDKKYCDIVINPSDTLSSLSPDVRCFLDGLRRKPIRVPGCFPKNEVIGAGMGMIFYSSNGLLYCY